MRSFCTRAALLLLITCLGRNPASAAFKKPAKPISSTLSEATAEKIAQGKRLSLRERAEVKNAEKARYHELRHNGVDEVSNTAEAAALRNYRLRNKKRTGLIRKKEKNLADILFPGVSPEEYGDDEPIAVYADLVESRKNPIPYEYYDMPYCAERRKVISNDVTANARIWVPDCRGTI